MRRTLRIVVTGLAAALHLFAGAGLSPALAFTREVARADGAAPAYGLSASCLLQAYNTCSGWTWLFNEKVGAVWGSILDPDDCPGGCAGNAQVTDIWFFSQCSPAPVTIGGVAIQSVNAAGCPTATLWRSGSLTVTQCVSGNRWTHVAVPADSAQVGGNPFLVAITWGASPRTRLKLASDAGVANLYCSRGVCCGFPGCQFTSDDCTGWGSPLPPQVSYMYVTDFDGNGTLDDLCALYGHPYPMSFPYLAPYGYLPNNLLIRVALDCSMPASVGEGSSGTRSSWGRVKALYD